MPKLDARLRELEALDLRRHLAAPTGVDLTSNDVLGLSRHRAVRDALVHALHAGLPHGGGASRLLTGEHPAWSELERRVADWQGCEAALFHSSGWAANTGLLSALLEPGDLVVSDALNHASLIDGMRLGRADKLIVPHGDASAIEQALAAHPGRRAWVVVESVTSMDGDVADLVALAEVCTRHGARLIVDEAHATGLFGPTGQGCIAEQRVRSGVFASVHTCGKALGLAGAFVCGSRHLIDWLVQRSRPFVFSTASPPFLAAGLHAALDLIAEDPALRTRPLRLGDRLRGAVADTFDTGRSATHIVPILTGTPPSALSLQAHLRDRGWDARAIRPPTVPEGTCRVRLVMHADLGDHQLDTLIADLLAWAPP